VRSSAAVFRLWFELARRGYRRYAAYPGATWAGVFTNTFFGFLLANVLLAVFEERGSSELTLPEAKSRRLAVPPSRLPQGANG
jgi:hypothetical protein